MPCWSTTRSICVTACPSCAPAWMEAATPRRMIRSSRCPKKRKNNHRPGCRIFQHPGRIFVLAQGLLDFLFAFQQGGVRCGGLCPPARSGALYVWNVYRNLFCLPTRKSTLWTRVKFFDFQPTKDHCLRPKFCPISVINIVDYYFSYIIITICKLDFWPINICAIRSIFLTVDAYIILTVLENRKLNLSGMVSDNEKVAFTICKTWYFR